MILQHEEIAFNDSGREYSIFKTIFHVVMLQYQKVSSKLLIKGAQKHALVNNSTQTQHTRKFSIFNFCYTPAIDNNNKLSIVMFELGTNPPALACCMAEFLHSFRHSIKQFLPMDTHKQVDVLIDGLYLKARASKSHSINLFNSFEEQISDVMNLKDHY